MRESAPYIKKVLLELGGKNAGLVFDDCDFSATVAMAARSAFFNQGQICLATSRLLVQRTLYDRFLAAMVEEAERQWRVGDPLQADTTLGALVSRTHRERVLEYIEMARAEGAQIRCGGQAASVEINGVSGGCFLPPTILTE